ncbi:MAG: TetR/AcrR family transcriptional regulator [Pyrinomonadaceae bacterium]
MHAKQEKIDRRVDRTVTALRTALIALIQEKHYDSITVQDIIDRANVGRSTFYVHFRDKEDVLVGDWKRFLDLMVGHIDFENAASGRFVPVRELMLHLKEYHALYRALAKSGKSERLFTVGTAYLTERIQAKIEAMTSGQTPLTFPPAVTAYYLANQIFAFLRWWLDQNMPYSPEEMDKMFHDLVGPGVSKVLGCTPHTMVRAQTSSIY